MRALIADDERLMREQLASRLQQVWPDLQVVGQAHDGRQAVEMANEFRPEVIFLDIRMPLMSGIEAAGHIARLPDYPCQVVFVTAYDEYAIAAFDQGAIDYLLKPVEEDRLARTVQRLKARQADSGTNDEQSLTQRLARIERALDHSVGRSRLKWLQASQGNQLRLIDVDEVLYFQSDEKYTRLRTVEAEFLIRLSLRDLLDQLDPDRFWQVHRGTVVRVSAIDRVLRDDTGRLRICLRGNDDTLEVSRSYHPLFRQM